MSIIILPVKLVKYSSKSFQFERVTFGLCTNIPNFDLSPKTVMCPFFVTIAKQCTIGVCATSAPLKFSNQQILSGRVKMAASALIFSIL